MDRSGLAFVETSTVLFFMVVNASTLLAGYFRHIYCENSTADISNEPYETCEKNEKAIFYIETSTTRRMTEDQDACSLPRRRPTFWILYCFKGSINYISLSVGRKSDYFKDFKKYEKLPPSYRHLAYFSLLLVYDVYMSYTFAESLSSVPAIELAAQIIGSFQVLFIFVMHVAPEVEKVYTTQFNGIKRDRRHVMLHIQ